MKWKEIISLVNNLAVIFTEKNLKLAVAESCTGGLIAASITEITGSSFWFERGFVTYSNLSKQEMLDVPESMIVKYGAVSKQVAVAMAEGALKHSEADVSLSVTGIAGPSGGSSDKPIGTVYFAWSSQGEHSLQDHQIFTGDRQDVRFKSCHFALKGLIKLVQEL
ncbi:CinA family protein [Legionella israelensis]|uniref:CinA family protein n=1 Tax=Legionella israelensis TaxID=454 RepID=A0AAX1EFB2_9GAMM|nr:CinA family protein [Legionella israelensis]QBR83737.1 CinA family protein [Legionella israelensis]